MQRDRPFLGVLMLDTAFPRILGDAGNPNSYPFPTKIETVTGAGAPDVVAAHGPRAELTESFIGVAQKLEADGAIGLVSTCGFLVHRQHEIAASVNIPVMVSALSLYPILKIATGGAPIGVLTASEPNLVDGTLQAAGIDPGGVEIAGLDGCKPFSDAILAEKLSQPSTLDAQEIEAFAISQAKSLLQRNPSIKCFLLECGNLPPYAEPIRAATDRPVFSILDAAQMIWNGSERQGF
ncbi:hypothetical protein C1J03_13055 [Sulfitobacter sp. SK012]|uniref:aspartate/glutamate racemase family protein n=1 Tax=Sulfitobacter sp. SK012 TaxID=1389005 RepID=UPI000E0B426B|nr:aspartate/glutamate racemase family protein [Sulfitobacter sp. SK012]AXI46870.1 hypothetical protein C1J03_13055 [Sulfitobacter sp. SK012]